MFLSHWTCLDQYEGMGIHACSEFESQETFARKLAALRSCSDLAKTTALRFKRKGRGAVEKVRQLTEIPCHILP